MRINFNGYYSRRLTPAAYRSANFNVNANGQLKNLWFVGILAGYEPEYNDFNEPRMEGRVFRGWESKFVDAWVETNQAKKYSVYTEVLFITRTFFNSKRYQVNFSQRYRFNDRFSIRHQLNAEPQKNNVGFADISGADVIFGLRNRNTIENIFSFKYNFNSRMGLNTRIRHYWSKVEYKQFFTLLENGALHPNPAYTNNRDQNVNFFNVDMVYTWQFAPGSFLNIVWKNSVFDFKEDVEKNYFRNFSQTMEADQNNNLSLKVIYFLDYLDFRKWTRKKK